MTTRRTPRPSLADHRVRCVGRRFPLATFRWESFRWWYVRRVRGGHTILINGASGGVGSAAVQFALDRGATVIGAASLSNQDYLASLGAVPTTYGPGLVDRVRALAPTGIDAAVDIAGSGIIAELVELTGEPTRVVYRSKSHRCTSTTCQSS
jgi:NADPH:quinone reductase-like Zn-dependent oxidoreductase